MSGRKPTGAGEPPPADPADLLGELAAGREQTADLLHALTAQAERTEALLRALNEHELTTSRLLRGVADVLGSFDRLLAYESDVDIESYRASVRRTAAVLADMLWNNGVELIGAAGEIAEPDTHRVVEVADNPKLAEDAVVSVIQRGIRYQGRLIRPASVIVSSGRDGGPEPVAARPATDEEQP